LELWKIPKRLATFDFTADQRTMIFVGEKLVSYRFTPKWTVSGRWRSTSPPCRKA
jgi:hypothetical protein